MTKRCLDEGVLQAYLDGELAHGRAAEAAAHLAACDACSAALAEAEEASALFATAFSPDETVSVPTQILRSRIGAAVAQLESRPESNPARGRNSRGLFATLAGLFSFTPQTAAAFAGLLAVVALGDVSFYAQKAQQQGTQTQNEQQLAQAAPTAERPPVLTTPTPDSVEPTPASTPDEGKTTAGGTSPVKRQSARRAVRGNEGSRPRPTAPKQEVLAGESEYRTAIASLEQTIKLGGDASLKPTLRAEYERNLALLDSAITQTRQVAASNPKDETAVGFLMAAYQSKVELLSKVADQAQVSALGR
jgi:hypothetical protein